MEVMEQYYKNLVREYHEGKVLVTPKKVYSIEGTRGYRIVLNGKRMEVSKLWYNLDTNRIPADLQETLKINGYIEE